MGTASVENLGVASVAEVNDNWFRDWYCPHLGSIGAGSLARSLHGNSNLADSHNWKGSGSGSTIYHDVTNNSNTPSAPLYPFEE